MCRQLGLVMAMKMDNEGKIAKINAELARLELEMELDYSDNHDSDSFLGVPKWISDLTGGAKLTLSEIADDINTFETRVITVVFMKLKIFTGKTAMDAAKINTTDTSYVSRVVSAKLPPAVAWKFVHNKKDLILFFWTDKKSSCYSVFDDASGSSKFEFDKMPTSVVWEDRAKKATKKVRFVKAHLHADILTASGEWDYIDQ